ncbi:hypothetical protein CBI38_17995 [Rhodococcus oxybenzonivorans]|uniref:Uncharacterized protein n=1 Tax=Rhodococcus oxybenzonivorans TaxID=1990687 RepID=A0A2S2BX07_9NOCA|nr:hypothetical protein [Rhodococcus oxybenzonivorans]AWK73167.1 hypothetical protein CBI38_17995 [Rhodococcus oxybenzonivorans]
MAKHEIAPEDLNASHIGQYVKVSLVYPADGVDRATFLVGAVLGVEHKVSEDFPDRDVLTTVTVDVAVNEVPIVLPNGGPVEVGDTLDELMTRTEAK